MIRFLIIEKRIENKNKKYGNKINNKEIYFIVSIYFGKRLLT